MQESEDAGHTGLTDTSDDEVFSRSLSFYSGNIIHVNISNSNFRVFSQEPTRGRADSDPDYHLDVSILRVLCSLES